MQRIGDKVGDYVLQRRLGAGNFGEVWLAQSSKRILHRQVALKFAYPGKVKLAEVEREARVWQAAGGHANVLALVDAWIEGDGEAARPSLPANTRPMERLKNGWQNRIRRRRRAGWWTAFCRG